MDDAGNCHLCTMTEFISNKKCIQCNDKKNGGIEGCYYCIKKIYKEAECKECLNDYILISNNYTCIKRDNNKELEEFENCSELKLENNKFICSRCKPEFSLLKTGEDVKCTYIPDLYDFNFNTYYDYHYYYQIFKKDYKEYSDYRNNDYNYRRNNLYPCKESINIGKADNPLYSCNKCYNIFDNEDYDDYVTIKNCYEHYK